MKINLLLIGLFFSINVFSQPKIDPKTNQLIETPIGKVTKIFGKATKTEFKDRNKEIDLKVGSEFFKGDILKSEKKSIIKIDLEDETSMTIGPESEFEFTHYAKEGNNRKATFTFLLGEMRAKINKPAPPGNVEFKMRKISMGIRGTEIISQILKDKEGNYLTKVLLTEGKAYLDLTDLNLKNVKEMNLEVGKILDTALAKPDALESDLLIPISDEQMKKLLSVDGEEYKYPFLVSLSKSENELKKDAKIQIEDDGLKLNKKKKQWNEILEEDQNKKIK